MTSPIVPIAEGVLELLGLILPRVPELHPGIVAAVESRDETLARRLLQEALERDAFELERIAMSAGAPKRTILPSSRPPADDGDDLDGPPTEPTPGKVRQSR